MQPNSFDLMYMFAATCGVLFLPIIFGFIAVLTERE
jgi:membrane glycosyltransferase